MIEIATHHSHQPEFSFTFLRNFEISLDFSVLNKFWNTKSVYFFLSTSRLFLFRDKNKILSNGIGELTFNTYFLNCCNSLFLPNNRKLVKAIKKNGRTKGKSFSSEIEDLHFKKKKTRKSTFKKKYIDKVLKTCQRKTCFYHRMKKIKNMACLFLPPPQQNGDIVV